MERVLYVVARERPLMVGYLMTMVGARSSDGRVVEIKLDERRGERRQAGDARQPERRRSDRRQHPSLDGELGSRGYAAVVQPHAGASRPVEPAPAPAMVWRPRSRWMRRVARAGRRVLVRWGLRDAAGGTPRDSGRR